MDLTGFLGLEPTPDPLRWRLPLNPRIITPTHFLNGGAGFGACMTAMEIATGRDTVWSAAQFVAFSYPPDVLDLEIEIIRTGRTTTHARCTLRNDDGTVMTTSAALGRRADGLTHVSSRRPDVPDPEHCDPIDMRAGGDAEQSLLDGITLRRALGSTLGAMDRTPFEGRTAIWIRLDDRDGPITSADLAIVADFVPFDIGQALGYHAAASSIDNTLRVCATAPHDWVLLDIGIQAVSNGVAHADSLLWARDGTLLGIASQSGVVRVFDPDSGRFDAIR